MTLIDTPGYGEYVDTERSFEAICHYVEGQFAAQLIEESDFVRRAPEPWPRQEPTLPLLAWSRTSRYSSVEPMTAHGGLYSCRSCVSIPSGGRGEG